MALSREPLKINGRKSPCIHSHIHPSFSPQLVCVHHKRRRLLGSGPPPTTTEQRYTPSTSHWTKQHAAVCRQRALKRDTWGATRGAPGAGHRWRHSLRGNPPPSDAAPCIVSFNTIRYSKIKRTFLGPWLWEIKTSSLNWTRTEFPSRNLTISSFQ